MTGRYLGEILEHFGGEMNLLIPEPSPADGIVRFIANASLLGRLAAWQPLACSRSRSASTSVGSYDALTRRSRPPTFLAKDEG